MDEEIRKLAGLKKLQAAKSKILGIQSDNLNRIKATVKENWLTWK